MARKQIWIGYSFRAEEKALARIRSGAADAKPVGSPVDGPATLLRAKKKVPAFGGLC